MKLTKQQLKRLKTHSIVHTKKHMTKMRQLMKQGKSFNQAHKVAMKQVGGGYKKLKRQYGGNIGDILLTFLSGKVPKRKGLKTLGQKKERQMLQMEVDRF